MKRARLMDHILYCCLSQEQREQLKVALDRKLDQTVSLLQQHLVKEKDGYRCGICGKCYPLHRIYYQGEAMEIKRFAKIHGKTEKYKKVAVAFFGDHYYAHNKKTLLKFEMTGDGKATQTAEIPVMSEVYHTIVSDDEEYIATETFQGTVSVIDASAKQMIAKKTRRKINGSFAFVSDNELLYFFQETIRCWNFIENKERIIWKAPKAWKASPHPPCVVCISVIHNTKENTHWFQCVAGQKNYAVVVRNLAVDKVLTLPPTPWRSELTYAPGQNVHPLGADERILLLDGNGQVKEIRACPQLQRISDVGGDFPVLQYTNQCLQRVVMSPDGKWFLLDYFAFVILMNREDSKIYGCIHLTTGRTAMHMGFRDDNHFWYTWGDTTYVQEVPETT